MIAFRGVTKSYRRGRITRTICHDLSFTLPKGRNMAIMGPNGVGKSTLLRLIAGSEPPSRGQITRAGRVSWPLGFSGGLHGAMTGRENARFVARLEGLAVRELVEAVQANAGIGAAFDQPVRDYSTGMRARLAFALSLAAEFDCYLIDEIIAVGDEAFRARCSAALKARTGRAQVVMVSHAVSSITEFCDCGLYLSGRGAEWFDDIDALVLRYRQAEMA